MKATPESKCPACGYLFNMASDLEGAAPGEGDISICLNCGHLMAFNSDLTVRELNDKEMYDVAGDKLILQLQEARAKAMRDKA